MSKGPQYRDSSDRIRLARVALWLGPTCYFMLSLTAYLCLDRGWISRAVFVALLVINLPISIAAVLAVHRAVGRAAVGLVHTIYAVGDIAPARTYPRQDVLIARGEFAEAASWFRDHLVVDPTDHDARLRLAQLLEMQLREFDEAERLYLQIRRAEPPANPRQQMQAANGLIDLYRKVGRRDRLKVELGRFVDRYRGSPLAEGAARELKELKTTDPTSE